MIVDPLFSFYRWLPLLIFSIWTKNRKKYVSEILKIFRLVCSRVTEVLFERARARRKMCSFNDQLQNLFTFWKNLISALLQGKLLKICTCLYVLKTFLFVPSERISNYFDKFAKIEVLVGAMWLSMDWLTTMKTKSDSKSNNLSLKCTKTRKSEKNPVCFSV